MKIILRILLASFLILISSGLYKYFTNKTIDPVLSIVSFNCGQVSPYMEARSDFAKYPSFCRTLENMLVLSQGPAVRRPGTAYIATAKTGNGRLIPFEYSTDDTYIIELGNLYARFYRNGGQASSIWSSRNFAVLSGRQKIPIYMR